MSVNDPGSVEEISAAFMKLLAGSCQGGGYVGTGLIVHVCKISLEQVLSEEEKKTNDMVRKIKERLGEVQADSTVNEHDWQGMVKEQGRFFEGNGEGNHRTLPPAVSYGEWIPSCRERALSSVSSTASSSMRLFDEEFARGWQPVDELWTGELNRMRPAWKCKYCEGVGWGEDEPCEGCGRYLPENLYAHSRRAPMPMREGDWICMCCGNTNWEWRRQCNRCHTCRMGEVIEADGIVKHRLKKRLSTHPAGVFKDNDWVCVTCGNINWDWRSKCHQCCSAKPVVSAQ